MIILEGPDNSGKSTLAKLFKMRGFAVVHPGGAPSSPQQEEDMMLAQANNAALQIVHDRVTCISNPIYNLYRGDSKPDMRYGYWLSETLAKPGCVLVYCRPPIENMLNFATHEAKAHDSAEHLKMIESNAINLIKSYDLMMSFVPHIQYDYTNAESFDIDVVERLCVDLNFWHSQGN
jgi:hypothetical protein